MRTRAAPRPSTALAYIERVNRAIDFAASRLAEPLSLKAMARAASLSPFHFHRVFQCVVGETPADFVKRLRLERALVAMTFPPAGRRPSLARIAAATGFSSPSDFSRSFRQRFGASPSRFDIDAYRRDHRAELEALVAAAPAVVTRLPAPRNPDRFRVRIRDLPARTVAYIRVHDPYRPDAVLDAARRLVVWAERQGVADRQWLGYQWDNPELVPLEMCRYHAAVEAPKAVPDGEIGRFGFPVMTVAEVEIRGGIDLELRALQWLYGTWLPRSGYVPDDHPVFEAWIGRPFAHGVEHFEIRLQLPVRRG